MNPLLMFMVPAVSAIPARLAPRSWSAPLVVCVALIDATLAILVARGTSVLSESTYFAGRYFVIDPTSLLFLLLANAVFLGISVYMHSRAIEHPELEQEMPQVAALSLAFMACANLAILSNHLIVMWSFIEGTTLAAAPLVARGDPGARRAAWNYVLFSVLSLSLTLFGFLCLSLSCQLQGEQMSFFIDEIADVHGTGRDLFQRLGLALVFFGLGSKLGLAPLYGWLPQTYDLAPPSASALLAAVQFNATTVALFRVLQVFRAEDVPFVSQELLVMGGLSLFVAAIHVMAARNYKRLIAYACVSSSGVIAIGLAVGRKAAYGVVLYVVSNAFVKTLLFLSTGRLSSAYGSKDISALTGIIKRMPYTGLIFTIGIFALLGFPPFGSFMAEMLILSGVIQEGHLLVFTVLCTMLTIIFVATGRAAFPMIWGLPSGEVRRSESALAAIPKIAFVAALVSLGIFTPEPAVRLLRLVASSIGEP